MVAKSIHVDYDMQTNKITNLGAPSGANDAVTKAYADAAVASVLADFQWKQSVRAATTVAGTLATSFENGDTVDGVVLVTANRILIKDQAAPAENGIYVVQASGAPVRALDADNATELLQAAVFVQEGTTNAEKAFVNSTDAPIVINTTGLVFIAFPGSGVERNVINSVIDGNGAAIAAGIKFDIGPIPFSGVIEEVTLLADQSGSIVVDIWKDTYANYPPTVADSITAAALPTISAAAKSQDSTLTGWTTTITAGDILRINVNSATTITRVTLGLKVRRT